MISEFALHASDLGFRVTEPIIPDGRLRRVNWRPDSGTVKPGWYVAFSRDDASGGGPWGTVVWGDWRDGWKDIWTTRPERRMTPAERAHLQLMAAQAREAEKEERRKAHESARRRARWLWEHAEIDPAGHPYLARKRITAEPGSLRVREHEGRRELLVPLRDEAGALGNLQRILPDGTKRFVKGGGVAGLHWRTGPLPPEGFTGDLVAAEGVATAATVRQLSGCTVWAAMNSGNLPAVVAWMRRRWPAARILIAADDDRWERDGTPRPAEKNAGRTAAAKAAESTRALMVPPAFGDVLSRGTDWNDLLCEEGGTQAPGKWRCAVAVASLDRRLAVMAEAEYVRCREELLTAYAAAGLPRMGVRELHRRRREAGGTAPKESGGEDCPQLALLAKICAEAELWHDQAGRAFATLPHQGVALNARVEGEFFKDWLRVRYNAETGDGPPPGREALQSIVERAASTARLEAPQLESHFRIGYDPGTDACWLDPGRRDWRMVRYAADGWRVMDRTPLKFLRAEGDCALPLPALNPALNGLQPLWEILNVAEEDRCLIAGWLLGALRPTCPAFGLNLHGGQGTAKSTATRILRRIIDPQPAAFQSLNERRLDELGLTCIAQWVPCFENISHLAPDVQDALCSLTTGFAARSRKLFTDDGIISYELRRPWILNGINNVCTRNDLAERSIPVSLMPVPPEARKTEEHIHAKADAIRPHVLAVLLDAAVLAQQSMDQAEDFLSRNGLTHRMADALKWITAGEDGLGFMQGTFITRLNQLQEDAGFESLTGNPVLSTLEILLDENSPGRWKGTHEELLDRMHEAFPESKRAKYLPHDAVGIGNWFRRETDRLRKSFGIEVGERRKARINSRQVWVREIHRINKPASAEAG
ncbi:MAG: hypothetical protein JWM59_3253 [Verrucomicrobiales bacterium]|nr:hypothetical protein [Verrucomicrobiales bacterium]